MLFNTATGLEEDQNLVTALSAKTAFWIPPPPPLIFFFYQMKTLHSFIYMDRTHTKAPFIISVGHHFLTLIKPHNGELELARRRLTQTRFCHQLKWPNRFRLPESSSGELGSRLNWPSVESWASLQALTQTAHTPPATP